MQGCPSGLFGNSPVTLSEGLNKLISEHIPLRNSLENLFSLCGRVEKENSNSFEQLAQQVKEFFENLEYHSSREEEILFRMMENYLGEHGGPIAVMEYEHEQSHGFINEFLKNAESIASLTEEEKLQNAALIVNAYHTLLNHFAKEEQVLYPMAERMLSPEEKEAITQKVSE